MDVTHHGVFCFLTNVSFQLLVQVQEKTKLIPGTSTVQCGPILVTGTQLVLTRYHTENLLDEEVLQCTDYRTLEIEVQAVKKSATLPQGPVNQLTLECTKYYCSTSINV
jgi:hypothetical protein